MERPIKEFDTLLDLLEDLETEGITGGRRKRIVDDFLLLQARKNGIPFTGGFELTPLCNFDCRMCYVHLSFSQMAQEKELLTTEQWIDIMRQAVDAGMIYADLTGGECLTYPGFKDVYLYLLSRGVRVADRRAGISGCVAGHSPGDAAICAAEGMRRLQTAQGLQYLPGRKDAGYAQWAAEYCGLRAAANRH